MYNIKRRKSFNTVYELKMLLAELPDDSEVCICGDSNCWFHIEKDESVICLDNEDLEESYVTYDPQDVAHQFAILWGMEIGMAMSCSEIRVADILRAYESDETAKMFSEWAQEFVDGEYDDTTDFLHQKIKLLTGNCFIAGI